ncbi:hypothetical protein BJX62DRAFT_240632 [Aspergillus germanicus]
MSGLRYAKEALEYLERHVRILDQDSLGFSKYRGFESKKQDVYRLRRLLQKQISVLNDVVQLIMDGIPEAMVKNETSVEAHISTILGPSTDRFNSLCCAFKEELPRSSLLAEGMVRSEDVNELRSRAEHLKFIYSLRPIEKAIRHAETILKELRFVLDAATLYQSQAGRATRRRAGIDLQSTVSLRRFATFMHKILVGDGSDELDIAFQPIACKSGGAVSTFTLHFKPLALDSPSPSKWHKAYVEISPSVGDVPNSQR